MAKGREFDHDPSIPSADDRDDAMDPPPMVSGAVIAVVVWWSNTVRSMMRDVVSMSGCVRRALRVSLPLVITLAALGAGTPIALLKTGTASFGVDDKGALCAITRTDGGRERQCLAPGQPAPLLSLRVAGQFVASDHASWNPGENRLSLTYPNGVKATVSAVAKAGHVVFEVLTVAPAAGVELVLWGPYPTTIDGIIGETIGVVRDNESAIGIQALNAKTLGGFPAQESDSDNGYGGDDKGQYADLPAELLKGQDFRGDTAVPKDFGSILQAYCRNRNAERVIRNWGHEQFVAKAFDDGGVVGSKIALFACPASKALATIGTIEEQEGLPHPMIDGVWGKVAPGANCAYLIVDFSEQTIDRAIEMTRRAGLTYLYHSSAFETWGHFKLKESPFPNGWQGFRACVEKARKAGVRLGFHTLSNFITPNDAYVSPKPDPRLARIGESELTEGVDAEKREIEVASPDYFKLKTAMNTVVVGEELIKYTAISTNAPWKLLDCQRGAWGTRAGAHERGAKVGKLMDHDYHVFLTDASLSQEVGQQIAAFCNETGALQLSLDGLEGNWSTGMGQYGRTIFTKAWYDALSPEIKGRVINDASNPGHFNWHIYTRMNWGEPWYAGFRESQTLYRFKNQVYFERNLMPRMLGWFALRPDTSVEDAEWLLARAAGFDAGFALASSLASTAQLEADPASADAAKQFGATPAILEAIKQWETARAARAFPPAMKALLRDNTREFHLEAVGSGGWELREAHGSRFVTEPAKASGTEFAMTVADAAQPLLWTVTSTNKEPVKGLWVRVNGGDVVRFGEELVVPPGGRVKYAGGGEASICDATWKEVRRVPVAWDAAKVAPGKTTVGVGSAEVNGSVAGLKVEVRTLGQATKLRVP